MGDSEELSIRQRIKKLERYVRLLSAFKRLASLGRDERGSLLVLSEHLADAGKLVHDASATEDPIVRADGRGRAVDQLIEFRQSLLVASQYDLADAADVAELSAMSDQIIDAIKDDTALEWQQ